MYEETLQVASEAPAHTHTMCMTHSPSHTGTRYIYTLFSSYHCRDLDMHLQALVAFHLHSVS